MQCILRNVVGCDAISWHTRIHVAKSPCIVFRSGAVLGIVHQYWRASCQHVVRVEIVMKEADHAPCPPRSTMAKPASPMSPSPEPAAASTSEAWPGSTNTLRGTRLERKSNGLGVLLQARDFGRSGASLRHTLCS